MIDKFNQLNWIVTAFTLTSTAFIPIFGQLSDTFGRHAALQLSLFWLNLGSILCATAPNWPVLLLGRALQGVGTAGMMNVSLIVLADKVSLKEQATNSSIFQLLQGIGYSVGPVIGGYLVDSGWRYVFVLCAALGGFSMVTIFFLRNDLKPGTVSLSRPARGQTRLQAFASGFASLDIGGTVLFIFGVGLIILGTAWGGSTFPWKSAGVICPIVIGAVLVAVFVVYEKLQEPGSILARRMPKTIPLIPFSVLRNKDVGLICFVAAGAGSALYSVFYFIGIYFTLVEGLDASNAGVNLLYYVPGIGVGAYLAIALCTWKPRQTFWPLFLGTLVETGAMAALAAAVKMRNATFVNVMMGVAGAGTGVRFMPFNLHLAGMFRDQLAPVFSLLRFAMPFGGTLALTIMGSVFQNEMSAYFGSSDVRSQMGGVSGDLDLHNTAALDAISKLPPAEQGTVRARGATATMWAFISILPFLVVGVVAATGLGNVWISKQEKGQVADTTVEEGVEKSEQSDAEKTRPRVLTGVYLLALFKGRVRAQRRPGPLEPLASSGEEKADAVRLGSGPGNT